MRLTLEQIALTRQIVHSLAGPFVDNLNRAERLGWFDSVLNTNKY